MGEKGGGAPVRWEIFGESIEQIILVGVLVHELRGYYSVRDFFRVVTLTQRVYDLAWIHMVILLKRPVDDDATFELGNNARIYFPTVYDIKYMTTSPSTLTQIFPLRLPKTTMAPHKVDGSESR
jgi:hypothetical protein